MTERSIKIPAVSKEAVLLRGEEFKLAGENYVQTACLGGVNINTAAMSM